MFYEGTEKRLLICTNNLDLLTIADSFWHQLVAQSGAEILSCIQNSSIKAYLLSESSLFIWQDKLLLITCGNTKLVNAALFIQKRFGKQQISSLVFQRHQALKPHLQPSNFKQDILLLEKLFKGQQQHWRDDYQGDLFLFGDITQHTMPTQGIYMLHGLRGELAEDLQKNALSKTIILKKLKLESFFNGLTIDHFSFNPKGYSLNALCGEDYLTIHLTPEQLSTYLSIETSFSDSQCIDFINHLQQLFSPERCKKMHFKATEKKLDISLS